MSPRPDACRALVRRATDAFGRLDIMHANAGIELCRAVWDTSDDDWRRVIDINLSGAFYCSREAMSAMREQDGSGVISSRHHRMPS
jgi:NAD(P)-dependent dehydrogenase (short-subunit alcohol dehydrogenase family)